MTFESFVWVDGRVVTDGAAAISPLDHGVTVGDGVFETMQIVDGHAFALTRHLARLRRSAAGLRFTLDLTDEVLRHAVAETIVANRLATGRVRITITTGHGPLGSDRGQTGLTVMVVASRQDPWPSSTEVVTVPWRRNEHSAIVGLKTTSYAENVVALEYAHERGASEAIFPNTAGLLCEGTGTNIFVERDGILVTPPLASGCLAGITRELVLEALAGGINGPAVEADITLDDLANASEAFLTSSTRDVQPIAAIDGRGLPLVPGLLTSTAIEAFARLKADHLDP